MVEDVIINNYGRRVDQIKQILNGDQSNVRPEANVAVEV